MREVEQAVGDAQRFAGGMDVAKPRDQIGDRLVGGDVDSKLRRAEESERAIDWWRLEDQ